MIVLEGRRSAAKALLENLKSNVKHGSKRENLDIFWQVLESIRLSDRKDFSAGVVGQAFEKAGGLKAQSFLNAGGRDFRNILNLYKTSVSELAPRESGAMDNKLGLIADPGIRKAVALELDAAKRLKAENDSLKALFAASKLGRGVADESLSLPKSQEITLSKSHVEALRKGISEARLTERGWSIRDDGAIIGANGKAMFPPLFAHALFEVIKQADSNWDTNNNCD